MSDYTPSLTDEQREAVLDWMELPTKPQVYEAVARMIAQVRVEEREQADQEPSDAESLARDAEEKYPIPAPVDHLTTSDYTMRVVFVQGRRQGYIDARKEMKR